MKGKKLAVLALCLSCILFGGCGKKTDEPKETSPATEAVTEATTEAATEEETTTAAETSEEATTEAAATGRETRDGMVRSYLTGEWVEEAIGNKRPLAIMINNVKGALPCNGLNSAGVIYETPMEGGEVRLEMLIEDYENLERIGSVRSARTYHPQIASEFNAIFVHYGRSKYVVSDLSDPHISDIDGVTSAGGSAFYRTDDRKAPHNAFTRPSLLDEKFEVRNVEREYSDKYTGKFQFAADDAPITLEGQDASKVTIGYLVNKPWFEYNAEENLYYRYEFGEAQIDELDGKQIACRNIIVQYCDYEMQPDDYTTNIYTEGEGKGVYITGGKAEPITWSKPEKWGQTTYCDESGNEIVLNQGTTWVCLVLPDMTGEISVE